MKYRRARIILALQIFVLTVSPHACLVEQAIASILHGLPHGHHDEARAHTAPTPSHHHDAQGSEAVFCCDNNLNLYIGIKTVTDVDIDTPELLYPTTPDAISFEKSSYPPRFIDLHRLRSVTSSRARDKYALTCLLHAPPFV
jgi:hypothetical protein